MLHMCVNWQVLTTAGWGRQYLFCRYGNVGKQIWIIDPRPQRSLVSWTRAVALVGYRMHPKDWANRMCWWNIFNILIIIIPIYQTRSLASRLSSLCKLPHATFTSTLWISYCCSPQFIIVEIKTYRIGRICSWSQLACVWGLTPQPMSSVTGLSCFSPCLSIPIFTQELLHQPPISGSVLVLWTWEHTWY